MELKFEFQVFVLLVINVEQHLQVIMEREVLHHDEAMLSLLVCYSLNSGRNI